MTELFCVKDIKSRIGKDSKGASDYRYVSIEEMDWLVNQVEQLQEEKEFLKGALGFVGIDADVVLQEDFAVYQQIKQEAESESSNYEDLSDEAKAQAKITHFIMKKGYTYTISDVLKSYLDYHRKGYYVSHTMQDCITELKEEIKLLLKEEVE